MDVNVRAAYAQLSRARKEFDDLKAQLRAGDYVLRSELDKFVFLNLAKPDDPKGYEERLNAFEELDKKLRESRGERFVLKLTSAKEDLAPEHGCFGGTPGHYSFEERVYSGILTGDGLSFAELALYNNGPLGPSVVFPTENFHERIEYSGSSFLRPGEADILPGVLERLVSKSHGGKPNILLEHLPHLTGIKSPISSLMSPYSSEVLLGKEANDFLKTLELGKS